MARTLQTLPSARTLAVFEAAGRLLNFSAAAREVGISQAAVSKQVQALEAEFGAKLFVRSNRGLTLTSRGNRLHQAVTTGLGHIRDALEELKPRYEDGRITITTTIALASIWLMPRIAKFRAVHPSIDLRVIATDELLDLVGEGIDVGLRYGVGGWPGTTYEMLFTIELFPVCSPAYLARSGRLAGIADLADATLLHLEEPNSEDADWKVWLKAVGAGAAETRGGLRFNNYPLLMQAAANGHGVALGWGHVIDDLLGNGTLVRCLPVTHKLEPAFFLVRPSALKTRPEVDQFAAWMIEETAALRRV